jgi:hypothetical protein
MQRDILGGNDITDDYPDLPPHGQSGVGQTYEGIHTLIIGEHITGMAAY